jgi:SM-20-related protein
LNKRLNAEILAAIAGSGCYVGSSIFSSDVTDGLRSNAQSLHASGGLTAAHVGRAQPRSEDVAAERWRGDAIKWLDDLSHDPVESAAIASVNTLRLALNSALFIGAQETELHYARYARGTFYKTHFDRFGSNNTRVISLIFYLNEGWISADGGELVIYDSERQPLHRIAPCSGTMVAFLSERFAHEVLPTQKARMSVSGWMRRRALPTGQ